MSEQDDHGDILAALGLSEGVPEMGSKSATGATSPTAALGKYFQHLGKGAMNLLTTPGRAMSGQSSPDEQYDFGPAMALNMLGIGAPRGMLGEAGLGTAGGKNTLTQAAKEMWADAKANNFKPKSSGPPDMDVILAGIKDALGQKDISQTGIDQTLAKNPGASIFDVAGTHVGGPSSSYLPSTDPHGPQIFNHSLFSDLPRTATPSTPLAANILGTSENLVHGTRLGARSWETPEGTGFGGEHDALKLPEDELGVHFGNPRQAQDFSGSSLNSYDAPRQYPVVVATNNPLTLPDLGTWHPDKVTKALHQFDTAGRAFDTNGAVIRAPELQGKFPQSELNGLEDISDVRKYLQSKGYDSVRYTNVAEDPGHTSYIKFTPSPVAPDYITGVRSPYAKFDPNKLSWPELAAGIGGMSAGTGLLFDQDGKPIINTK